MIQPDITQRVLDLAAEQTTVPRDQITPESAFTADLSFDSLAAVEFAMQMEDEFEIQVPDDAIARMTTVREAIEFVEQELSKTAAT